MQELLKSLKENGYECMAMPGGFYYRNNLIDLVDNTHMLEGGFLTPLIKFWDRITEERQFANVTTIEQLNAHIAIARKLHRGNPDSLPFLV